MKLLVDESLSPKLTELLADLFPESESALRNGLAGSGDLRILEDACAGGLILVSTDRDFERLLAGLSGANVVITPFVQLSNWSCGRGTPAQCDPHCRVAGFEGSFDHTRQVVVSDSFL